jgi:hypothetical protein
MGPRERWRKSEMRAQSNRITLLFVIAFGLAGLFLWWQA